MRFHRLSAFALAAGPVLLGVACADNSPSAPTVVAITTNAQLHGGSTHLPGPKTGATEGTDQAAFVWCEQQGPASASAEIGPSGGVIAVGRARLTLPPGALTTTVHITATASGADDAVVTFQPSGLQFKKPAALQFDVTGCAVSGDAPDIVYLNDEGVIVERIEAVYSNYWRMVAAPVDHFSAYALAW